MTDVNISTQERDPGTAAGELRSASAQLLRSWIDAWNARDGLAALYSSDGLYEDVPSGYAARGSDIDEFARGFAEMVGGLMWELTGGSRAGDRATAEWSFSGTNEGLVSGEAASGKPFSVRGSTTFVLDGEGKIRRSSDYYDYATILRQVGALPEDARDGEPA